MRLSTMPGAGSIAASSWREYIGPSKTKAATRTRNPMLARDGLLRVMAVLGGRLIDRRFGFGFEIDDLETERIPAARLGILGGLRIGVLNRRHPVAERLERTCALARGLQIAHLREVRKPARTREKAH